MSAHQVPPAPILSRLTGCEGSLADDEMVLGPTARFGVSGGGLHSGGLYWGLFYSGCLLIGVKVGAETEKTIFFSSVVLCPRPLKVGEVFS